MNSRIKPGCGIVELKAAVETLTTELDSAQKALARLGEALRQAQRKARRGGEWRKRGGR